MNPLPSIQKEIAQRYSNSTDAKMQDGFFEFHVAVVAKYAEAIAKRVGANEEVAVLGALFHDIARVGGTWGEPALTTESLAEVERAMEKYKCKKDDIAHVQEAILHHSCRNELPKTVEGKVLATADAMAHLMTDFYLVMFNKWTQQKSFAEYKKWVLEKIERDFHKKIFFEEDRKLAKPRYEALKLLFS